MGNGILKQIEIAMKKLNQLVLSSLEKNEKLILPTNEQLNHPERVLQFGTGVLLRGLPDHYIDQANREGRFNGRVVVVKSTSAGDTNSFFEQDCLYTISVRGIESDQLVNYSILNSSISRVLSAKDHWNDILACAANPDLKVIISNTTEVGIVLMDDDIHASPPISFPGKLLSFLFQRYSIFNGSENAGMVILPTELISDNGFKLFDILIELAHKNNLSDQFIDWLKDSNYCCNTLVDRIVPGKMSDDDIEKSQQALGYQDELMIMAEPFSLWAIESDSPRVKEILSFVDSDNGCFIVPNIEKFKELKLRLLNATHTFSCGLSFLANFELVRSTMKDATMHSFISQLSHNEIVSAITSSSINEDEANVFATSVLERFANPFIDHKWSAIAAQYSSKMRMRSVPLIVSYYQKEKRIPICMALGFAGFLLFMKCKPDPQNSYWGELNGIPYKINDDNAAYFSSLWDCNDPATVVDKTLSDKAFWDTDLSELEGFNDEVKKHILSLMNEGIIKTILSINFKH
jgi:tagaturonate reductase